MNRGFIAILSAQFFTALADNALLFAAIALLATLGAPAWQIPVLQQSFVVAFIVLAPFVGYLADALPKGQVMSLSNAVKIIGGVAMLLGAQPLLAYACVGVGAAMYSPAKYGILSEYFSANRLVWANGWMEGVTVAATIFGALSGGALVGKRMEEMLYQWLDQLQIPPFAGVLPQFALAVVLLVYLVAIAVTLAIPKNSAARLPAREPQPDRPNDFVNSFRQLWHDPLGQLSLVVTALLWGVGTTLRFVILAWSAVALRFDLEQGAQLTALVVIGIGIGAVWAGAQVKLAEALGVLKLGMAMGLAVAMMAWVEDWRVAIPLLVAIGVMAGYLLVPMNALLQHRGHRLMGTGHSIAMQNVAENVAILAMLGSYALLVKFKVPPTATIVFLGIFIVGITLWFMRTHAHQANHQHAPP